ncbi:MAG: neutral/alkaline non-lysosomal ceramidase N-terminal domain-containing protein [Candidatus Hydrogenedentota bacterium]
MRFLVGIIALLLILVLVGGGCMFVRMRGPFHSYELDVLLPADPAAQAAAGPLEVGVAMHEVTPDMSKYDTWTDVNDNSKFDPDVDTYEDRNGNGRFDGVWLAGFGTNRPAKGIHDPLWARAIAMRNNGVTVAMVTVDSIGLFHNTTIRIRKAVEATHDVDHVVVSATHNHEVPDTMKIWSFWKRIGGLDIPVFGFDEAYLAFLEERTAAAVKDAVDNLAPANMYAATLDLPEKGFVRDSRKPHCIDNNVYLWRFTEPETDTTIATFVNWGNHPETLGSKNSLVTSDFVHYLREGVEKGVSDPNGAPGVGGMCLYFQGMVGGLMTQLGVAVPHRSGEEVFEANSFEKAQALGENVALAVNNALRDPQLVWQNENPYLAVGARTMIAPAEGHYKWAIMLGLLHEGYYLGRGAKTEVNVLHIGDVRVLTVPGEVYPEIVKGPVEARPGRDFDIEPVEEPPLYDIMDGKQNLCIGLANDEIGYILPKSQWDAEPPWTYGNDDQYGEGNSPGPDVGPALHATASKLIRDMEERYGTAENLVRAQ